MRDAVVKRFGPEVAPGGVVDRSILAEKAFATPQDRAWLESLIWPLVAERMASWRARLETLDPPPRAAIVEVPLLFESGMDDVFDATISVVADESLREERAGGRGHRALDERAARQLSQQEKAARSTYVVVNDGDFSQLERRLAEVIDKMSERG